MFEKILSSLKNKNPIIHCITNPISITRCADAILAVGARPIMAEHPKEVEEITANADALVLNLGNITDARMDSMVKSVKAASKKHIPVVIDAVGIACSRLRRNFLCRLLENKVTLIKGNYSEIKALYDLSYNAPGVDAVFDDIEDIYKTAVYLAKKYNAIILASGKEDVVTDGKKVFAVKNGTPQLAKITGTGCMLGVLCGCYLTVSPDVYGGLAACGVLGICGEHAETKKGNGAFAVKLMDELSSEIKEEELKIEEL